MKLGLKRVDALLTKKLEELTAYKYASIFKRTEDALDELNKSLQPSNPHHQHNCTLLLKWRKEKLSIIDILIRDTVFMSTSNFVLSDSTDISHQTNAVYILLRSICAVLTKDHEVFISEDINYWYSCLNIDALWATEDNEAQAQAEKIKTLLLPLLHAKAGNEMVEIGRKQSSVVYMATLLDDIPLFNRVCRTPKGDSSNVFILKPGSAIRLFSKALRNGSKPVLKELQQSFIHLKNTSIEHSPEVVLTSTAEYLAHEMIECLPNQYDQSRMVLAMLETIQLLIRKDDANMPLTCNSFPDQASMPECFNFLFMATLLRHMIYKGGFSEDRILIDRNQPSRIHRKIKSTLGSIIDSTEQHYTSHMGQHAVDSLLIEINSAISNGFTFIEKTAPKSFLNIINDGKKKLKRNKLSASKVLQALEETPDINRKAFAANKFLLWAKEKHKCYPRTTMQAIRKISTSSRT